MDWQHVRPIADEQETVSVEAGQRRAGERPASPEVYASMALAGIGSTRIVENGNLHDHGHIDRVN
jgi:hypothetical protein